MSPTPVRATAAPPSPSTATLDPDGPLYDQELLKRLRGSALARGLRTLAIVGAHRYDEARQIDKLFPGLERIYLFEPLEAPLATLRERAARDPRIRVFPVAVSDVDGTARFNVASNDGESSSLLSFGSHQTLFPHVGVQQVVEVRTRRLEALLAEEQLPPPDVLIVDVQGAEYQVLASLGSTLRQQVRVIYTETSTEPVYAGSRLLPELEALLAPRFHKLGFAPLRPGVTVHGNALFVAGEDVPLAFDVTLWERLRRGYHGWRRRDPSQ
jgi:FkbM family methyltransferase